MKTQAQTHSERLVTLEQAVQDYLLIQRVARSHENCYGGGARGVTLP